MADYYAQIAAGGPDPSTAMTATSGVAELMSGHAAAQSSAVGEIVNFHQPRMSQALPDGLAGTAQDAAVAGHVNVRTAHEDTYLGGSAAASNAHGVLADYAARRHNLAAQGAAECEQLASQDGKDTAAAVQAEVGYWRSQVGEAWAAAGDGVTAALSGKLIPPPDAPPHHGDGKGDPPRPVKHTDETTGDSAKPSDGEPVRPVKHDVSAADAPPPDGADVAVSPPPSSSMPASALAGAGAAPSSGGGAASSLGGVSGMRAPSLGGSTSPSVPSVPAGVASPSVPTSAASTTTPPNLNSAFQAGLASESAAAAPVMPMRSTPNPQAAFFNPNQPPAVAVPPPSGSGGAMPAAPLDTGPPVASGGPAGGSVGGPAPMMTGGPMSPYSLPGSGGQAAPTVPSTSPTAAPSPPPVSGAGAPLVAGAGGATTSAGLASAAAEENPDLVKARRLLAELVHGTDASGVKAPIMWAVSVLHATSGVYTYVASSVGGGDYLPARVYLSRSADLAVCDPRLPAGWADRFTACQRPSAVLAAHFAELREHVLDLRVSAIVTSEMPAKRPLCGGSWEPLSMYEAQRLPGEAPQLDGWHRHRLAVTDPGVWSRLQTIDRKANADTAVALAAAITETVLTAAAEPDDTGRPLAIAADEELWDRVKAGAVTDDDWHTWAEDCDQQRELAEGYAPPDEDESQATRTMQAWYTHWFRAARLVELLQCWDPRRPLSGVCDVVYTALAAGFPDVVAAAIADVERP